MWVREREPDGVVVGKTERLVHFFAAFRTIKEIGLDVVDDGEQNAAGGMGGDVAVCASDLGRGRRR